MSPTQTEPTFVIPAAPENLQQVEVALAGVINATSQDARAKVVGLSGHGQISRRESKLTTGEADTFLEVYPGHYLMRMGRASPALREEMIRFLMAADETVNDTPVERDLSAFAQRSLIELAEITAALEDQKITRIEAARRDTALQMLQEHIHQVRVKLGRIARGSREQRGGK